MRDPPESPDESRSRACHPRRSMFAFGRKQPTPLPRSAPRERGPRDHGPRRPRDSGFSADQSRMGRRRGIRQFDEGS